MISYFEKIQPAARQYMVAVLDRIKRATCEHPITAEELRRELDIPLRANAWKKQLNHMANYWFACEGLDVVSGPGGYFYAQDRIGWEIAIAFRASKMKAIGIWYRAAMKRQARLDMPLEPEPEIIQQQLNL